MGDLAELLGVLEQYCRELEAMPQDQRLFPAYVGQQLRQRVANYQRQDQAYKVMHEYVLWVNATYKRKFEPHEGLLRLVRALTTKWYTLSDLKQVTEYLHTQWSVDPKMAKWLVPTTMLTSAKFQERLDLAKEANAPRAPRDTIRIYAPPVVEHPVPREEVRTVVETVVGKLKRGG